MYRFITFLAVLLLIGTPGAALAQDSAAGTVTGQVINGTAGGGSVSGVTVTLITYVDDIMSHTETTVTDSSGQFRFEGVPIDNEYLVSANYMGVDYYYQVVFSEGETVANVEVPVCDTTESDEMIRLGMAHTIIDVDTESVLVTQYLWLVNDGDRTYAGTDAVLVFTMPEGATEFGAPAELMTDYQLLDNQRVSYLVPFPPGERQLAYYYRLPRPDSGELAFPLEIDYPADGYELLVSGEDIEVTVTQLAPAEPVTADSGERYIHFQGEDIARGASLEVQIHSPGGGDGPLLIAGGMVVLVFIGIAFYFLNKRRKVGRHG